MNALVSRQLCISRVVARNTGRRRMAVVLGSLIESYDYNGDDGPKQKATLEHVFSRLLTNEDESAQGTEEMPPWMLGWQMNERNVLWNDELKLRLIKRFASEQLAISEEEMDWRLAQLLAVLPGLESRLIGAPPKLVARLAAHTGDVADRMLHLKTIFPQADISAMVSNRLTLLLDDDIDAVKVASDKLQAMLPDINVDRFVEAFPLVLDYDSFEMAVEDAKRIMPSMDLPQLLRTNPEMIMSLVKGKNLIPYDEFSNPWS